MKHLLLIALSFVAVQCFSQQQNVNIRGRVHNIPKATKVMFSGALTGTAPLSESKEFQFIGTFKTPGFVYVETDASFNNGFWVMEGEIVMELEGWYQQNDAAQTFLRVKKIQGPMETEKFKYFQDRPGEIRKRFLDIDRNSQRDSVKKYYQIEIAQFIEQNRSSRLSYELLKQITDGTQKEYLLSLLEDQAEEDLKHARFAIARDSMHRPGYYFSDFTQNTLNGQSLTLSKLKAKYILVDFWSSDCMPCRRQHPELIDIYSQYKNKGFDIVSISLDDTRKNWEDAVKKDKLTWHQVSDLNGWKNIIALKNFVDRMPYNVLVDEKRQIIAVDISPKDLKEYLSNAAW